MGRNGVEDRVETIDCLFRCVTVEEVNPSDIVPVARFNHRNRKHADKADEQSDPSDHNPGEERPA